MLRRLIFAASLAVTACATGPSLQSRMAAFIGAPPAELVEQLGVPDKQIAVNGVEYLAYVRRDTQVTPGVGFAPWGGPFWGGPYWGGGFYGGGFFGGIPPQIYTYSCETTFAVINGKVASFTLRGNDCL